jgi:hypothetical protein
MSGQTGVRKLLEQVCRVGRRRDRLADATPRTYVCTLDAQLSALQQAIKGYRRYLLVFLTNRDIRPTNNGSEQASRACVI